MASYLVTGASRGIGYELTKQLVAHPSSEVSVVFALIRDKPSDNLSALIKSNPERVVPVTGAVNDEASITSAAAEVEKHLGDRGLDVLVNNAGTMEASPGGTKGMKAELLTKILDVNVVGVQRVTTAFLPLLEKGGSKKVINITSTLGSVAMVQNFKHGPVPAYKISKAALNMLNAQWAMDYEDTDFTFLLISPGWLKTDLGGDIADLPVEVGVAETKRIIMESTKAQSGKFMNIRIPGQEDTRQAYNGKEVPW